MIMRLKVNRKVYDIEDEPDRPLIWVLRDELGLTGTKYSCGSGICGSCMVHVDGVVTHSCITMLSEVKGKRIRTIEGLPQSDGPLHPVQQAFIDEQAPQCGWCMSGQIMNAAAFLEENPNPTEEEIVSAMSDNYCRCGTYGRIKRAVQRAAREMATEAGRDHE
jgi:isoquinoline 1-oxidoreductase alpha subunit